MQETKVAQARKLAEEMRFDDALVLWREICVDGPPDARNHFEMAICLIELGSESEALYELETALALDFSIRSRIEDDWRFSSILRDL